MGPPAGSLVGCRGTHRPHRPVPLHRRMAGGDHRVQGGPERSVSGPAGKCIAAETMKTPPEAVVLTASGGVVYRSKNSTISKVTSSL